jgi:type II secretory pathway component GspD/PulD (secretin)
MSRRFLTRSLLTAALTLGATAPLSQAQHVSGGGAVISQPAQSEPQLVERLYAVADLVVPPVEPVQIDVQNFVKLSEFDKLSERIPTNALSKATENNSRPAGEKSRDSEVPARTREGELINMITTCVDPTSWADKGGKATIAYHAGCMTLAVHALPAHHERIAAVLSELRRQQEMQVALEVRLISYSGGLAERVGLNFEGSEKVTLLGVPGSADQALDAANKLSRVIFLNSAQAAEFQEAIQSDQHTNIMQLPKITVFNGQKTRLSAGDVQSFVTNMDSRRVGEQAVMIPRCEVMPTSGFFLSARPTISADRRFVKLDLQTNFTKLATPNVQLFPVTTLITPVFEGGAQGQPVPFTQFLQQPVLTSMLVDCTLNLPDGGSALLTGYRQMSEAKNEFRPPMLSKIPYLNRLFKNVGYASVPTQVAMLVTPRIILDSDAEMRAILAHQVSKVRGANPTNDEQKSLAKLLEEYHQACTQARLSEAQALAARALLLDPTCFTKR